MVESLTLQIARFIVRLSANPIGYLVKARRVIVYDLFGGREPTPEPSYFEPNRYQIPLGAMVFWVILCLASLIAWGLIALSS